MKDTSHTSTAKLLPDTKPGPILLHRKVNSSGLCADAARLTSSMILANRRETSLLLSLNHLLKRECALTSISCPWGNLQWQTRMYWKMLELLLLACSGFKEAYGRLDG